MKTLKTVQDIQNSPNLADDVRRELQDTLDPDYGDDLMDQLGGSVHLIESQEELIEFIRSFPPPHDHVLFFDHHTMYHIVTHNGGGPSYVVPNTILDQFINWMIKGEDESDLSVELPDWMCHHESSH